jgi:hypothetical protein
MLWSEEWARHHGPVAVSSEAENRPRGRQTPERGGESPEGALGPRARRRIARGGARPSSEVENRPRGTAAGRLVGRYGFFGPWAFRFGLRPHGACFVGFEEHSFAFYYFSQKGFFLVIREPLWLSPTRTTASVVASYGDSSPNPWCTLATGATPKLPQLPSSARTALRDSTWMDAMRVEYDSLLRNKTWSLVERPPGVRVISGKCVFKYKLC